MNKALKGILIAFVIYSGLKMNGWVIAIAIETFARLMASQKSTQHFAPLIIFTVLVFAFYIVTIIQNVRVLEGKLQSVNWLIAANVISAIFSIFAIIKIHPYFALLLIASLVFGALLFIYKNKVT